MNKPTLVPEALEVACKVSDLIISKKDLTDSDRKLILLLCAHVKGPFESAKMFDEWENGIE